jgi:DNA-binding HxlR family transcriptional regulator
VGRSGFYSSLKILDERGLIVREGKRVDGKNLVYTELTEKGNKITKAVFELYQVIEQEFPE